MKFACRQYSSKCSFRLPLSLLLIKLKYFHFFLSFTFTRRQSSRNEIRNFSISIAREEKNSFAWVWWIFDDLRLKVARVCLDDIRKKSNQRKWSDHEILRRGMSLDNFSYLYFHNFTKLIDIMMNYYFRFHADFTFCLGNHLRSNILIKAT